MTIARLNGEVIAESNDTVVLDGHRYFPAQSVRVDLFRPTSTRDDRPWYSICVQGKPTPDVACYYSGPSVPDPRIADHVLFHDPVQVED